MTTDTALMTIVRRMAYQIVAVLERHAHQRHECKDNFGEELCDVISAGVLDAYGAGGTDAALIARAALVVAKQEWVRINCTPSAN